MVEVERIERKRQSNERTRIEEQTYERTSTMGRYSTDDFGYDFPSKEEETISLVTNDNVEAGMSTLPPSSEGGVGYELYEDNRQRLHDQESYSYHPAKINRGGENFFVSSGESIGGVAINPVECVGAFCCCIAISLVIVGGILLAYVKYKDEGTMYFVGTVLLVFAAGICLFSSCTLCIGTSTDGLLDSNSSGGQFKADPHYKEVQVRFRRLNDRYEKGCMKAEEGLQHVRLDVVGHMKEVRFFSLKS